MSVLDDVCATMHGQSEGADSKLIQVCINKNILLLTIVPGIVRNWETLSCQGHSITLASMLASQFYTMLERYDNLSLVNYCVGREGKTSDQLC